MVLQENFSDKQIAGFVAAVKKASAAAKVPVDVNSAQLTDYIKSFGEFKKMGKVKGDITKMTWREVETEVDRCRAEVESKKEVNATNTVDAKRIESNAVFRDSKVEIYRATTKTDAIQVRAYLEQKTCKRYSFCVSSSAEHQNLFYSYRYGRTPRVFYFVYSLDTTIPDWEKNHILVIHVYDRGGFGYTNATNVGDVETATWGQIVSLNPNLKDHQSLFVAQPLSDKERGEYTELTRPSDDDEYDDNYYAGLCARNTDLIGCLGSVDRVAKYFEFNPGTAYCSLHQFTTLPSYELALKAMHLMRDEDKTIIFGAYDDLSKPHKRAIVDHLKYLLKNEQRVPKDSLHIVPTFMTHEQMVECHDTSVIWWALKPLCPLDLHSVSAFNYGGGALAFGYVWINKKSQHVYFINKQGQLDVGDLSINDLQSNTLKPHGLKAYFNTKQRQNLFDHNDDVFIIDSNPLIFMVAVDESQGGDGPKMFDVDMKPAVGSLNPVELLEKYKNHGSKGKFVAAYWNTLNGNRDIITMYDEKLNTDKHIVLATIHEVGKRKGQYFYDVITGEKSVGKIDPRLLGVPRFLVAFFDTLAGYSKWFNVYRFGQFKELGENLTIGNLESGKANHTVILNTKGELTVDDLDPNTIRNSHVYEAYIHTVEELQREKINETVSRILKISAHIL